MVPCADLMIVGFTDLPVVVVRGRPICTVWRLNVGEKTKYC